MNRLKTLLLLCFCLAFFLPTTWASEAPTVTVQGTSRMEIEPDQAFITLGVVSQAETAEAARAQNAQNSTAVRDKIAALGIAAQQIHTSQFVIYPVYANEPDKSTKVAKIIGYRVTNNITAQADDIASVGTIIDSALAAGANQVTNVRFQKKNDNELKKALLTEAVQNGLEKAQTIAAALNKKIKRVSSVTEQDLSFQQPDSPRLMLKAELFSSNAATPISPGTIIATGTVSLICELE
ncbi:MAG: SIMPL domain-containing protein [Sporomusaceae bacterium]|nr:SIMPL domain-containing protein [Sporomusaceae bacterium]